MEQQHGSISKDYVPSIASVLYGQALGDAYGMPSELLSFRKVKELFGEIDSFEAGHPENPASAHFVAAEITDDTQMALAICDAIIKAQGIPSDNLVAKHILIWADSYGVWDKNILGPSSSKALSAIKNGSSIDELENLGTTNGCVMRIAPLGCVLPLPNLDEPSGVKRFLSHIYACTSPTHKSKVALSAASAVVAFISASIEGENPEDALDIALKISSTAYALEDEVFYSNPASRIAGATFLYKQIKAGKITLSDLSIDIDADLCALDEAAYFIREYVGTTMEISDTVASAFVAAFASNFKVRTCAKLCANLGGDTDTIGAIACAICASQGSLENFDTNELDQLEAVNNLGIKEKAKMLSDIRKSYV